MKPTIEAEVDEKGNIRPKEPVSLPPGSQLLITVLGGPPASETALLSEASLAADWNRPEEDAAWAGLEPAQSFSSGPLTLPDLVWRALGYRGARAAHSLEC